MTSLRVTVLVAASLASACIPREGVDVADDAGAPPDARFCTGANLASAICEDFEDPSGNRSAWKPAAGDTQSTVRVIDDGVVASRAVQTEIVVGPDGSPDVDVTWTTADAVGDFEITLRMRYASRGDVSRGYFLGLRNITSDTYMTITHNGGVVFGVRPVQERIGEVGALGDGWVPIRIVVRLAPSPVALVTIGGKPEKPIALDGAPWPRARVQVLLGSRESAAMTSKWDIRFDDVRLSSL